MVRALLQPRPLAHIQDLPPEVDRLRVAVPRMLLLRWDMEAKAAEWEAGMAGSEQEPTREGRGESLAALEASVPRQREGIDALQRM